MIAVLELARLLLKSLVMAIAVMGALELILLGQFWIQNAVWYIAFCGATILAVSVAWRWINRKIDRAIGGAIMELKKPDTKEGKP